MNQEERTKAHEQNELTTFEEGYYFDVVHMFCDFLEEAYYESCANGQKWVYLFEVLKAKLPPEVYADVFGDSFSNAWFEEAEEKTAQTSQGGPDCADKEAS